MKRFKNVIDRIREVTADELKEYTKLKAKFFFNKKDPDLMDALFKKSKRLSFLAYKELGCDLTMQIIPFIEKSQSFKKAGITCIPDFVAFCVFDRGYAKYSGADFYMPPRELFKTAIVIKGKGVE
ncbi:hypothetical protein [Campylobacter gastrosuis]|uniref:Uncharacterized protein n=1 Tax=Campylobacter gastrosuis TaxID=2974576 RepID=A0ABT7HT82_9BACT|nr:hypothetical protein [Campylobacter gastrosuis]MDL0089930.1 hypothetical protein [Campylobacter gastrosuis]